ncbi:hypothetical protein JTE90_020364 [Oedothorax gibbosus]|uniref:Serpin domain-containing protein n=1 Tax=Oedothorax gibbosus TaxID=931172 RepID=A0AAV6TXF7_9ARAC|nr:hypothetical protein JTE90_020364 [Oedothorax gibbosus]
MHQEDYFGYSRKETFTVLQMPYIGHKVAMMILLPHSLDGIGQLEDQISPGLFKKLHAGIKRTKVNVSLPKFRFEYEKTMKETLQDLGLSKVFESNADLSGVNNKSLLYVSDVVHKAVIEVNETGSEAAAATAVIAVGYCMMIEQIQKFIVDHPFLFVIYSLENYALLFLGKIKEL